MRLGMILIALGAASCGHEYDVHDLCTAMERAGREFAACTREVDHIEAREACDRLGASLAGPPTSHAEAREMGEVYAFAGETAWVGWPDEYECSVGGSYGSASPRDCGEAHAFVCEWSP